MCGIVRKNYDDLQQRRWMFLPVRINRKTEKSSYFRYSRMVLALIFSYYVLSYEHDTCTPFAATLSNTTNNDLTRTFECIIDWIILTDSYLDLFFFLSSTYSKELACSCWTEPKLFPSTKGKKRYESKNHDNKQILIPSFDYPTVKKIY